MTVREFIDLGVEYEFVSIWDYSSKADEYGEIVFCGCSNDIPAKYLDCDIESWNYHKSKTYGNVICLNIESEN